MAVNGPAPACAERETVRCPPKAATGCIAPAHGQNIRHQPPLDVPAAKVRRTIHDAVAVRAWALKFL